MANYDSDGDYADGTDDDAVVVVHDVVVNLSSSKGNTKSNHIREVMKAITQQR